MGLTLPEPVPLITELYGLLSLILSAEHSNPCLAGNTPQCVIHPCLGYVMQTHPCHLGGPYPLTSCLRRGPANVGGDGGFCLSEVFSEALQLPGSPPARFSFGSTSEVWWDQGPPERGRGNRTCESGLLSKIGMGCAGGGP